MTGSRTFLVAAVLAAALGGGCGEQQGDSPNPPGQAVDLATQLQRTGSHLDYEPLETVGSLRDVLVMSDVAGVGRVTDIRLAYGEALGGGEAEVLQHMFVVLEPEQLAKGGSLLGESQEVLLDQPAPPADAETGTRDLESVEAGLVDAGPVAFLLNVKPPGTVREYVSEFDGRNPDDPLFWPAHPSSVLMVDEDERRAWPLLTDELVADSPANLGAMADLGFEIESFSTGAGRG